MTKVKYHEKTIDLANNNKKAPIYSIKRHNAIESFQIGMKITEIDNNLVYFEFYEFLRHANNWLAAIHFDLAKMMANYFYECNFGNDEAKKLGFEVNKPNIILCHSQD